MKVEKPPAGGLQGPVGFVAGSGRDAGVGNFRRCCQYPQQGIIECWNVVRLAARNQAAVDDHFAVIPLN